MRSTGFNALFTKEKAGCLMRIMCVRAAFASMLFEMLIGWSAEDIVADYMENIADGQKVICIFIIDKFQQHTLSKKMEKSRKKSQ